MRFFIILVSLLTLNSINSQTIEENSTWSKQKGHVFSGWTTLHGEASRLDDSSEGS